MTGMAFCPDKFNMYVKMFHAETFCVEHLAILSQITGTVFYFLILIYCNFYRAVV